MGDDSRNNPNPYLLQAQCALQFSERGGRPGTESYPAPWPDSTTYNPYKASLKETAYNSEIRVVVAVVVFLLLYCCFTAAANI